jgi:hypothetical protein
MRLCNEDKVFSAKGMGNYFLAIRALLNWLRGLFSDRTDPGYCFFGEPGELEPEEI